MAKHKTRKHLIYFNENQGTKNEQRNEVYLNFLSKYYDNYFYCIACMQSNGTE